MNQLRIILIAAVFGLLSAACTSNGNGGGTTEPADTVPSDAREPTEAPATTDTQSPGETYDASKLRYPLLQVADGYAFTFDAFKAAYTSAGNPSDLIAGYDAAMEAQGCSPAGEAENENGIGVLYLCPDGDAMDGFAVNVFFGSESMGLRDVEISFDAPEFPDFGLPVPEGAEDVENWGAGATFSLPSDSLGDYFLQIERQHCEAETEIGSPNGGVFKTYVCLDESGSPLILLGVSYEDDDITTVSLTADPLFPAYVLSAFPEGALEFTYATDGTLAFYTPLAFEDAYSFFRSDYSYFARADCSLAGETGGAGGATALQFFCTDYYSANFTYEFLITVVIREADNGTSVQMTIE